MKLHIQKRSGKPVASFDLSPNATVDELKEIFYREKHYYPERQRFTKEDGTLLISGTLGSNKLSDGSVLFFKDLGVQISWRLVFVIEYFGPLLIAPAFFYLSKVIYGQTVDHSLTQKLGLWLIMFHFVKRELESLFVHRFSHATMPIVRLPINCFHYWILCGLLISYFLFHPLYRAPFESPLINFSLGAAMIVFEVCSLQTHLILRNLRPRGTRQRSIPYGWGFDYVSCANYFWETCAWACFCILVHTLTAYLFLGVAFAQMAQWAFKKHRNYRKDFKEYPKNRKAIVPFLM